MSRTLPTRREGGREFYDMPRHWHWVCFHCGEAFPNTVEGHAEAAIHFGTSPTQRPACLIDAAEYRKMEEAVRGHVEEDTMLHREIERLNAEHATALRRAEEQGYERGLADSRALTRVAS